MQLGHALKGIYQEKRSVFASEHDRQHAKRPGRITGIVRAEFHLGVRIVIDFPEHFFAGGGDRSKIMLAIGIIAALEVRELPNAFEDLRLHLGIECRNTRGHDAPPGRLANDRDPGMAPELVIQLGDPSRPLIRTAHAIRCSAPAWRRKAGFDNLWACLFVPFRLAARSAFGVKHSAEVQAESLSRANLALDRGSHYLR